MVHEDVVELDIPVQHTPTVAVRNAMDNLLEDSSCSLFVKVLSLFDKLQQVSPIGVFHHKQEVLGAFEHFKKPNDVRMADFAQNVHLLHHLLL